ncbi:MAG: hypothetical protein J7K85_08260, partial [Anaerolineaceae bacterium]|nr:hypothetical protein [Anaerolineaceae bacterium]
MPDNKNVSGLSDHILRKKKGTLATPFNDAFGESLKLSSWGKERMPEYLWLGLILLHYGRHEGLERAGRILFEISGEIETLVQPKLSKILSLPDDKQIIVYEITSKYAEKEVIAPLTILFKKRNFPLFNQYFYVSHLSVEERINVISEAIEKFLPHQSNDATDLRFLVLSMLSFKNKLIFSKTVETAIKAVQEYAYTNHEDQKMRRYRPTIRSMEVSMSGLNFEEQDMGFSIKFWKDFGMITPCNLLKLEFEENTINYREFIDDCRK